MRLASWNVNGLRAVERKGELEKFVSEAQADIIFFQETKASVEKLTPIVKKYPRYTQHYHSAIKAGYAGTGCWIRRDLPDYEVHVGFPGGVDPEGRIMRLDIGGFTFLGIYFPNGGKSPQAWEGKLVFYEDILDYVNHLRGGGAKVLFCGDVNCAHEEVDIARAKENDGNIGFHPLEREKLTKYEMNGWVDVYRRRNPDTVVYSYWDLYTRARQRNVGWRLDYFFSDEKLLDKVVDVTYFTEQMGSDHCPVLLELKEG